jgi:argininosuccinate lyase
MITNNLPSGYFRDLQIIKEVFIPTFSELNSCLEMTAMMMAQVKVNTEILSDSRYDYLFSVEEVNRLTLAGVPFRDAYKQVGKEIEEGNFKPNKTVQHTHQGSIGNLFNDEICSYKNDVVLEFSFEKVHSAIKELLK